MSDEMNFTFGVYGQRGPVGVGVGYNSEYGLTLSFFAAASVGITGSEWDTVSLSYEHGIVSSSETYVGVGTPFATSIYGIVGTLERGRTTGSLFGTVGTGVEGVYEAGVFFEFVDNRDLSHVASWSRISSAPVPWANPGMVGYNTQSGPIDYVNAQNMLDYMGDTGALHDYPMDGWYSPTYYSGSSSGTTGFEGSPEMGGGDGYGGYSGSSSGTTGFEGSPEMGGGSRGNGNSSGGGGGSRGSGGSQSGSSNSTGPDNYGGDWGGGSYGDGFAGVPIVIDLDNDGVELSWLEGSPTYFDQDNDGYLERTAWASSDDGLLVIDLAADGSAGADGVIDQTDELQLANWHSETGHTDLEGLADAFDSNNDGVFDAQDARFGEFRVWQDLDQDGVADEGELRTLDEAGIASINLQSDGIEQSISGNFIAGHTSFTRTDGTVVEGGVGDVAPRTHAANDNNVYRLAA